MQYHMTIKGLTPLIMDSDGVLAADEVTAWQKDSKNKGTPKGDDRHPMWKWITSLYHDGDHVVMPAANLLKCLMVAAAKITVPGGNGKEKYTKRLAQSVFFTDEYFTLTVPVKGNGSRSPIPIAPFLELKQNSYSEKKDNNEIVSKALMTFDDHVEFAEQHGFKLLIKRASPQWNKKHVRVRPMFKSWEFSGVMQVDLKHLGDEQVFWDIIESAGSRIGLGNWRPSLGAPGPFGVFEVELKDESGRLVKRPSVKKEKAAKKAKAA